MNWVKRINDTIDYIENHLEQEILEDEISKRALCSIYNFRRMFSYIADQSLSSYIRNRRLTLAAFELLNGNESIMELAFKYGYTSHDSFTRAFQRFHGVLPSKVRTESVKLKSCPRISFQLNVKGDYSMNYQIEHLSEFTITGVRKRVITEKAFEIIPKIWEDAGNNGTMQQLFELLHQYNGRPAGLLGASAGGN